MKNLFMRILLDVGFFLSMMFTYGMFLAGIVVYSFFKEHLGLQTWEIVIPTILLMVIGGVIGCEVRRIEIDMLEQ